MAALHKRSKSVPDANIVANPGDVKDSQTKRSFPTEYNYREGVTSVQQETDSISMDLAGAHAHACNWCGGVSLVDCDFLDCQHVTWSRI